MLKDVTVIDWIIFAIIWYMPTVVLSALTWMIRGYRQDCKYQYDPVFMLTKGDIYIGLILGLGGFFTIFCIIVYGGLVLLGELFEKAEDYARNCRDKFYDDQYERRMKETRYVDPYQEVVEKPKSVSN